MITPAEVEAIERATLAAVAPEAVVEIGDWLVGLDPGTVRRAASAVPLRHQVSAPGAVLDQIEAAFSQAGLRPAFRLADDPGLDPVRAELARRGYEGEQPTLVMVAEVAAVRALVSQTSCEISDRADEAWASVFLGAGFDPIDGACRVRSLGRSVGSAFGSLVVDGATVAVGCGAFGHGWASFHGMRTDLGHRGKGYAGQVLVALAQEAAQRGYVRAFLQVEEQNHAARSLYQRAGFETAWRYGYWSQP